MTDKLEAIKKRYDELTEEIGKNEVIANQELWRKLIKDFEGRSGQRKGGL